MTTRARILLLGFLLLAVGAAGRGSRAAPPAKPRLTPANWTEQVGFAPQSELFDPLQGKAIQRSNLQDFEFLLPEGLRTLIRKYDAKLPLEGYRPIHPSVGYIEATNNHRGKARVVDRGADLSQRAIEGYVAGLPFPQPQDGTEVSWNYQYGYNGDDGDYLYTVYWVSANRGIERTEDWRWAFLLRTLHRTDLEPRPAFPELAKKGIQYLSMTFALAPYDKKGFGAVYSRSLQPGDMQGHVYVPMMRRVLRNTFGTRGDSWNATDLLMEDVRGFMGYSEWMSWRLIGKQTVPLPMHARVKIAKDGPAKTFDFARYPHWNPRFVWEPRPVYVVEAKPRLKDYPYGKMIMYFDAETFTLPYKEAYDRKGALWKVIINAYNGSADPNAYPPEYASCLAVDLQSEHATIFGIYDYKANVNLDPELFSIANLQKRGR